MGSGVLHWARKAMEQFEYKPTNLMISLLDEEHLPIYNWYVVNAVPKRLEISGINAANNEILVETLALNYQYFKYYDPASIALDAAAGLSRQRRHRFVSAMPIEIRELVIRATVDPTGTARGGGCGSPSAGDRPKSACAAARRMPATTWCRRCVREVLRILEDKRER